MATIRAQRADRTQSAIESSERVYNTRRRARAPTAGAEPGAIPGKKEEGDARMGRVGGGRKGNGALLKPVIWGGAGLDQTPGGSVSRETLHHPSLTVHSRDDQNHVMREGTRQLLHSRRKLTRPAVGIDEAATNSLLVRVNERKLSESATHISPPTSPTDIERGEHAQEFKLQKFEGQAEQMSGRNSHVQPMRRVGARKEKRAEIFAANESCKSIGRDVIYAVYIPRAEKKRSRVAGVLLEQCC